MNRPVVRAQRKDAGFTLIEALVAVTLMGLVVGALATVTAQWMPNWSRGLVGIQRNEQVAVALDRLVADLSAAEYVSANRMNKNPLFQGGELAVTFVRSAVGPNVSPGVEIVRITETADSRGPVLVRMRAPFVPLPTGNLSVDPIPFGSPVVLLRPPFRVTFAYAGPDGRWMNEWRNPGSLPNAVRFLVRNTTDRALVVATGTRLHVDMMAPQPEPSNDEPPQGRQAQPGSPGG